MSLNRKLAFLGMAMLFLLCLYPHQSKSATFTVTDPSAGWPAVTVPGSFAWAINQANTVAGGPHTIAFGISGTINGGSGNPAEYTITAAGTIIDGTTAPGYTCNPVVFFVGPAYNSFPITANNVTIRGIGIAAFSLNVTGSGFQMYGCWIGTNAAGTASVATAPGPAYGVSVTGGGATIGANTACNRNVFSMYGVTNNLVVSGNNNSVVGNYFNSNATGLAHINNNTGSSLLIQGNTNTISNNVFLGAATGNFGGIGINGTCNPITITNNKIGVNVNGLLSNGAAGYGNNGHGIYVGAAITNATITNNVISNNRQSGISFEAATSTINLSDNIVGLPGSGVQASTIYGNGDSGFRWFGGTSAVTNGTVDNNTVCNSGLINSGGFAATCSGIIFNGATVTSVVVSNNYTGIDRSFNLAGNQFPGIYFFNCGNMGGSNAANVVVNNNVVGNNGLGITQAPFSNGISCAASNYLTIRDNYVGIGPGGQNIGNTANGIEINGSSNFIIRNNNIQNNKGGRTAAQADACAGICCFNATLGTIQNNIISNNPTTGAVPNHGIVVQQGGRILIGGTAAGEPNTIQNNGAHGVFVFDNADYVQITRNIISCNTSMGISLNISGDPLYIGTKGQGNASYAAPGPTISLAGSGCPGTGVSGTGTQATGTAPANSTVEVFSSPTCKTCPNVLRGEGQAYLGTVTATAGGAYTYTATISGNLSATATGNATAGGCNGAYCRTSRFTDCQTCSLPVDWLFVKASQGDGVTYIKWATATEEDVVFYLVERSKDGINFEVISGEIKAAGHSRIRQDYSYTHDAVYPGVTYYRIREVDNNGKVFYSKVVYVVSTDGIVVEVAPNPATGNETNLTVVAPGLNEVNVKITDIAGRTLLAKTYENIGGLLEESLDVSEYPKGIYIVSITSMEGINYVTKLVKE